MTITTYSDELDRRLAMGAACLSEEFRAKQGRWLAERQNPDGGFGGLAGASDLYYTGFAARSATLLKLETPQLWSGFAEFIYQKGPRLREPADALSALVIKKALDARSVRACCPECEKRAMDRARATLEKFRLGDEGYRKTPGGAASLYQTFLAALCFELSAESFPCAEGIAETVRMHRGAEGGFSDLRGQPEGTNPTAAAMALAVMFEVADVELIRGAAGFLRKMQRAEGGFAAAAKAPGADLMSTFTAMATLDGLGLTDAVKLGAVGRFVKDSAKRGGGFGPAGRSDDAPDVEYTYYGLGTLALLAGRARGA